MEEEAKNFFLGLGACATAAVLFGVMFMPVKLTADPGNGIFSQWMMGNGILVFGIILYGWQGFAHGLYTVPMIGGGLWALGNVTAFPIISRLGMGVGVLVWNATNCLTGWFLSCFGSWFGLHDNLPKSWFLNICGLLSVLAGAVLIAQIEKAPGAKIEKEKNGNSSLIIRKDDQETTSTVSTVDTAPLKEVSPETEKDVENNKEAKGATMFGIPKKKFDFACGLTMALFAGFCYALTFYPTNKYIHEAVKSENTEVHRRGVDFVPSVYAGVFLATTTIFLVYAVITKNEPSVTPCLALPAFSSGIIWGIAQFCFFAANDNLPQAVSFPIITTIPGIISAVLSYFVLNEIIKDQRNQRVLMGAVALTLGGAILVGLSEYEHINDFIGVYD